MNYAQMNNDLGRYFRTLPKSTQENILQSGVVFRTETDLRRCVHALHNSDFLG